MEHKQMPEQKQMSEQIERITKYEDMFREAKRLIEEHNAGTADPLSELIGKLEAYYTSDVWKQDYADDEAGLLPKDLKRGVLSEDGIYNLLEEYKELSGGNRMKSCIVYASTHHGNTLKVIGAIARDCGVELIDATTVKEKDLSGYDVIGFASGIYATQFHQSVINFATANLPEKKKIFTVMTSASNKDFSKGFLKFIEDKQPEFLGAYTCKGYNTFGPFKLVGGTAKGHPDEADLKAAVEFYKNTVGE